MEISVTQISNGCILSQYNRQSRCIDQLALQSIFIALFFPKLEMEEDIVPGPKIKLFGTRNVEENWEIVRPDMRTPALETEVDILALMASLH